MHETEYIWKGLEEQEAQGDLNWDTTEFWWLNQGFRERIVRFLKEKCGINLSRNEERENLRNRLNNRAASKGIDKNKIKDIISRYFSDVEMDDNNKPKYDDNNKVKYSIEYCPPPSSSNEASRSNAYKLAALLELDYKKTEEFLKTVFRMHPFDLKDKTELLYYWFLKKGDPDWYSHAGDIRKIIDLNQSDDDQKMKLEAYLTGDVKTSLEDVATEDDLIRFIRANPEMFDKEKRALTAKGKIKTLAKAAQFWANTEGNTKSDMPRKDFDKDYTDGKASSKKPTEKTENISVTANHLLSTIYGLNARKNATALKRHPSLPNYNHLNMVIAEKTDKDTQMKRESSKINSISEDYLRKLIIVLTFYCYAASSKEQEKRFIVKDCEKLINDTLHRCDFLELYPYEEFDMMFYVAMRKRKPLEALRKIIKTVYNL